MQTSTRSFATAFTLAGDLERVPAEYAVLGFVKLLKKAGLT